MFQGILSLSLTILKEEIYCYNNYINNLINTVTSRVQRKNGNYWVISQCGRLFSVVGTMHLQRPSHVSCLY